MPPRRYSRHTFTTAVNDDEGRLYLTPRVPFGFRALNDTILHTVREGDTLYALAGRHYEPLPRAAGLWWIIADFQPDPIVDPTIKLVPGTTLFIPSLRCVQDMVFNEARRTESDV